VYLKIIAIISNIKRVIAFCQAAQLPDNTLAIKKLPAKIIKIMAGGILR